MRLPSLAVLVLVAAGCGADVAVTEPGSVIETDGVEGEASPWTELGEIESPGDFRFAVVSDRTGGHRDGVFAATASSPAPCPRSTWSRPISW